MLEGRDLYANVIIDIAHSELDRVFTYEAPDELMLEAGHRVLVPFGRSNKPVEGFVLAITDESTSVSTGIKKIIKRLEPYTALLPDQLELAEWIRRGYHCRMIDALRLMLPAQMRNGGVREKTVRMVMVAPSVNRLEQLETMQNTTGKQRAPKQYSVFALLASARAPMSVHDINDFIPNATSAINALIEKGLLVENDTVTFRRPFSGTLTPDVLPKLTDAQNTAVEAINGVVGENNKVFLLFGVTGSGKTEVYLRSIAQTLQAGKGAIMLVPEIALTPQTVERFRRRFGDSIAVMHSRLSPGEKYDEWRRIRTGRAKVVIGARSAVFAPVENLGMIIIDEEHENSYRSDTAPNFNAVDVAARRCKITHSTLILGSATPSLVSFRRAEQRAYTLLRLPERISRNKLPAVEIVDMRAELMSGNNSIFSNALHECLKECLERGEQAILFINRRGYSTFVSCRNCGYVFQCPNCDISTTYHKFANVLKCHYCGFSQRLPEACPSCGQKHIKYFGIGTQQVEEQVKELFPEVRTVRMDMDTTRGKNSHDELLNVFTRGDAQVLIGTQMIAKGLDIPNVTLVGVVAADSSLHIPDFRSAERTFVLLTQVAGRAGRAQAPGKVVIQTYTPEHPVILLASKHDYEGFYAMEMKKRIGAVFPPFSVFVRVLFSSPDESLPHIESERFCSGMQQRIVALLTKIGAKNNELLFIQSSQAPVKKREGLTRYQVVIKLLRTKNTAAIMDTIYDYANETRGACQMSLSINPQDMF